MILKYNGNSLESSNLVQGAIYFTASNPFENQNSTTTIFMNNGLEAIRLYTDFVRNNFTKSEEEHVIWIGPETVLFEVGTVVKIVDSDGRFATTDKGISIILKDIVPLDPRVLRPKSFIVEKQTNKILKVASVSDNFWVTTYEDYETKRPITDFFFIYLWGKLIVADNILKIARSNSTYGLGTGAECELVSFNRKNLEFDFICGGKKFENMGAIIFYDGNDYKPSGRKAQS